MPGETPNALPDPAARRRYTGVDDADARVERLYAEGHLPRLVALAWSLARAAGAVGPDPDDARYARLPREDAIRLENAAKHLRALVRKEFGR
jgi:hypothetical protein